MFIVIYGTRVRSRLLRSRSAFCGRCLEKTDQDVCILEEHDHFYFIEYGSRDVGTVTVCQACSVVVPLPRRDPGEEKAPRAERWADAFLDAHVLELSRADKSTWIGVAGIAMVVAAAVVFAAVWQLVSLAELPIAIVWVTAAALLAAVVLAYHRVMRAVGDALFSRAVDARLRKICELTKKAPRELADRAQQMGHTRLASHLALGRYERVVSPSAASGAPR